MSQQPFNKKIKTYQKANKLIIRLISIEAFGKLRKFKNFT